MTNELRDDDLGLQPAAPSSPLADMRAGLFDGIEDEIAEQEEEFRWLNLTIDKLDLPRFAVKVRFGKVPHALLRRLFDVPKKKQRAQPDWDLQGAVTLLLEACQGVFAETPDGDRYAFNRTAPDGEWPTFADDWQTIAANLPRGDEITGPRALIRRLYDDGQILVTATAVQRHSGYDETLLAGN
ncbi:hypothetical protein [Euzebya sp.]|uniref:hypothetical protein n=1 Tax=Euzebya sp. TaxID=1971409 RepID=UPI0035138D02